MDNELQLNFNIEPNLAFGYSTSGNKVVSINNTRVHINIKLGKNSAGRCSVDFHNLIAEHTQINQKNEFDKALTIQVYEEMIEELNAQISLLKK